MERELVKVMLFEHDIYGSLYKNHSYEDDKLTDVIAWLKTRLAKVPKECVDEAYIAVDSCGGYEGEHHAEVSIYYKRFETDAEMKKREKEIRAREEEKKQTELQLLEKLKKKYA